MDIHTWEGIAIQRYLPDDADALEGQLGDDYVIDVHGIRVHVRVMTDGAGGEKVSLWIGNDTREQPCVLEVEFGEDSGELPHII